MSGHRQFKKSALIMLALGLLLAAMTLAYWLVKRRALEDMHRILAPRAEVYAATIGGILSKYEFLPLALAQSAEIGALLHNSAPAQVARVNAYLEDINTRVGAFAVYVLDAQGVVLASSNWQSPTSYVGQNYAFRPYFTQAIRGEIGRFYGIGVSTGEAGLFITQPIWRQGRVVGVAAAKVSLDWLEQSWRTPGGAEQIWVSDANGVVILSSLAGLKFTSLAPLSEGQKQTMQQQRQFLHEALPALVHPVLETFADGAKVLALSDPGPVRSGRSRKGEFLAVGRSLAPLEWNITVLSDLAPVHALARNAAFAAMLAWLVVLLGILYARQRQRRIREQALAQEALKQAYDELEIKVDQRTADLRDSNLRLQTEVGVREQAEQTLRCAQAELVQSGKLAAIGQMAAGVTHELNQPLAALQTFSDNARVFIMRGCNAQALDNLSTISDLVKRLGYITSQLKAFARRSDEAHKSVHVQQAFAQAMLLLHTRMAAEQVQLTTAWPAQTLRVMCSEIGLEQVFTNLLSNALDAMHDAPHREITVTVVQHAACVDIGLADSGSGIAAAQIDKIFDPFFTTREQGLGLGLSISAGIIRTAGGQLTVRNRAAAEGGGAEFMIRLRCESERNSEQRPT